MEHKKLFGLVQLPLFTLSIGAGLMACLGLGWATSTLKDNCPLYADFHLTRENATLTLDSVTWGTSSTCTYCTFSPVVAVMYNVMWLWFYLLLHNWGVALVYEHDGTVEKFNVSEIPLLTGLLVCHSMLSINLIVSTAFTNSGVKAWCASVVSSLPGESCAIAGKLQWAGYDSGQQIYHYLHVAKTGSWLLLICMIAQTVICLWRLRNIHQMTKVVEKSTWENVTENETGSNEHRELRRTQTAEFLVIDRERGQRSSFRRTEVSL